MESQMSLSAIGITTTVAAMAFAGMVTSAVVADNIKRSGHDTGKGTKLGKAYKWAWGTSLTSGLTSAAMVGVVSLLIYKKIKMGA
jgi:hypothetical protein